MTAHQSMLSVLVSSVEVVMGKKIGEFKHAENQTWSDIEKKVAKLHKQYKLVTFNLDEIERLKQDVVSERIVTIYRHFGEGSVIDAYVKKTDNGAWNAKDVQTPQGWYGSIEGPKGFLAKVSFSKPMDERTLDRKMLEDSGVSGRKMHARLYQIWFEKEERYEEAKKKIELYRQSH